MTKLLKLATVSTLALMIAVPAFSQSLIGRDSLAGDLNEDLLEDIEDDAERDLDRFGNEGREQGFNGSVALRAISQTGNTESTDVGIGSDLNYVWGPNGIELQLNYAYSDGGDVTDGKDETLFYGLEYTRDFTPVTFGFAKLQGSYNGATDSEFETDTFLTLGAGYRVYNDENLQWSLQAGPGYRFASLNDIGSDVSEAAFGISSDYSHKLSETVFITNDTDVIFAESNNKLFNDLAINVSMTDSLALRTSLFTEYTSDVTGPAKSTDNTFGVSLVYSFN